MIEFLCLIGEQTHVKAGGVFQIDGGLFFYRTGVFQCYLHDSHRDTQRILIQFCVRLQPAPHIENKIELSFYKCRASLRDEYVFLEVNKMTALNETMYDIDLTYNSLISVASSVEFVLLRFLDVVLRQFFDFGAVVNYVVRQRSKSSDLHRFADLVLIFGVLNLLSEVQDRWNRRTDCCPSADCRKPFP